MWPTDGFLQCATLCACLSVCMNAVAIRVESWFNFQYWHDIFVILICMMWWCKAKNCLHLAVLDGVLLVWLLWCKRHMWHRAILCLVTSWSWFYGQPKTCISCVWCVHQSSPYKSWTKDGLHSADCFRVDDIACSCSFLKQTLGILTAFAVACSIGYSGPKQLFVVSSCNCFTAGFTCHCK